MPHSSTIAHMGYASSSSQLSHSSHPTDFTTQILQRSTRAWCSTSTAAAATAIITKQRKKNENTYINLLPIRKKKFRVIVLMMEMGTIKSTATTTTTIELRTIFAVDLRKLFHSPHHSLTHPRAITFGIIGIRQLCNGTHTHTSKSHFCVVKIVYTRMRFSSAKSKKQQWKWDIKIRRTVYTSHQHHSRKNFSFNFVFGKWIWHSIFYSHSLWCSHRIHHHENQCSWAHGVVDYWA